MTLSDYLAWWHEAPACAAPGRCRETRMPHTRPTCVLLADRHHNLTEGMRGLLGAAFRTVVMVADEVSLAEAADRTRPNVAVVDISLARDPGLEWLRTLRKRCPETKLIVLSVHDEECVRRAAMEAGADAVVLKRAIATDLLDAIEAVGGGSVTWE